MANIEALKSCPACGATEGLRYEFSGSCGFVECVVCGTTGPLDDAAADPMCDIDAALAAWNRRTKGCGCPFCGFQANPPEGKHGKWTICTHCDAMWPSASMNKQDPLVLCKELIETDTVGQTDGAVDSPVSPWATTDDHDRFERGKIAPELRPYLINGFSEQVARKAFNMGITAATLALLMR